jgi:hypothetical protein
LSWQLRPLPNKSGLVCVGAIWAVSGGALFGMLYTGSYFGGRGIIDYVLWTCAVGGTGLGARLLLYGLPKENG